VADLIGGNYTITVCLFYLIGIYCIYGVNSYITQKCTLIPSRLRGRGVDVFVKTLFYYNTFFVSFYQIINLVKIMYVSVIVPVYNESMIINENINKLKRYLESNFAKYEIILVDDGSTDKTVQLASEENILIISLGKNKGKGAAVCQGMRYAEGDYAFFIDCDLPYPLSFVDENIHLLNSCNIVVGRRSGKYPLIRRVASATYNKIAFMLFHIDVSDLQCGIKGFDKTAYKSLFRDCKTEGFAFDTEILVRAKKLGFKITERPALLNHRKASGVNLKGAVKMLWDVIKIKLLYS